MHGFSSPQFVWDGIAELLVDAGYSVLAYDHFAEVIQKDQESNMIMIFILELLMAF